MIFVCYNILSILLQVDLSWVIVTHHIDLKSTSGAIWAHSRHIQRVGAKLNFYHPYGSNAHFTNNQTDESTILRDRR